MKQTLILLAFVIGLSVTSFAQNATTGKVTIKSGVSEAQTVSTISKSEVKTVAPKIVSSLNSALKLTSKQKSKVSSAVTKFMKSKAKISDLASTNKSEYATKLAGLTTKLNTKLKGVLTSEQYTKFMSLKSTTASGSVVSKLFE
jgi:hypothetical protein